MVTPLVLKKPLRVYKVGTVSIFCGFISLYRDFRYHESQTMPTVKINPEFIRCPPIFGPQDELWSYDNFYIYEGYHSYLTKEMAKLSRDEYDDIGIFEIPVGATIYVNYKLREVVSTDIKYLGLLEE
jgi:hypothetical protein